jgi:hypothetical protein
VMRALDGMMLGPHLLRKLQAARSLDGLQAAPPHS